MSDMRAIVTGVFSDFRVKSSSVEAKEKVIDSLARILETLTQIFFEKDGSSLTVRISQNKEECFEVIRAVFEFDDRALKSFRQPSIGALRDKSQMTAEELEAKKGGMIYVKYVGRH